MTNYNERLYKALALIKYSVEYGETHGGCPPKVSAINRHGVAEAKQAITSLFKELVAEAKPKDYPVCENNPNLSSSSWCNKCWTCGVRNDDDLWNGIEIGIEKFEQNLLKALETLE